MVRLLRRSARLLLAGVIGAAVCPPLAAQDHSRSVGSVQITTSQMRLEAMKAEMALLADYHTFQLPLLVRVGDDCVELHGRVSDDETRQYALRVARQSCYLPVRDQLKVAASRSSGEPRPGNAVSKAARDVISRALGDRVSGLDVQVDADGQVTLTGHVGSMEDRLVASRALREMPGCQSVVNHLTVDTVRESGHTLTLVTRDGKHAVHGAMPAAEPESASPRRRTNSESDASSRRTYSEPAEPEIPQRQPVAYGLAQVPLPPTPGLPPARDVYVRLRTANQVAPLTYVAPQQTPAAPQQPAAPQPAAPGHAPSAIPIQSLMVAVPYPGQVGTPGTPPATPPAPSLKPQLTMRARLRNLLGGSEPTPTPPPAPAPSLPLLLASPAYPPTQTVAAPQLAPAGTRQPLAQLVAQGSSNWPPAHYTRGGGEPIRSTPHSLLANSPAIRLAARPEEAARPVPVAPAPAMTPRPEVARSLPVAPAPVLIQQTPALTPAPNAIQPEPAPVQQPVVAAPSAPTRARRIAVPPLPTGGEKPPVKVAPTTPVIHSDPALKQISTPTPGPISQAPAPKAGEKPPVVAQAAPPPVKLLSTPPAGTSATAPKPLGNWTGVGSAPKSVPATAPAIQQTGGSVPILQPAPAPRLQPTLPTAAPTPAVKPAPAAAKARPAASKPASVSPKPATPAPVVKRENKEAEKAAAAMTPSQVQKLVAKACGKLAKSIKVESGKDGRITVHIHAGPASDQEIINRLMSTPEIAASNFKVQIHLPN